MTNHLTKLGKVWRIFPPLVGWLVPNHPHHLSFLPMVPEGGTMGQQMDFFSFFFFFFSSSSSFTPTTFHTTKFFFLFGTENASHHQIFFLLGTENANFISPTPSHHQKKILLGTENANFQTGLTFQATLITPISSCSFSFYFLECFCLENCPQTPSSPVTSIVLQYNPALGWIYN